MNLDLNTLFLVTIYVEAILGLLLLFAWVQNAPIRAVAWWGCAASDAGRLGRAVRHVRHRCRRRSRSISPTRCCSSPLPSPGPARACSTGASRCRSPSWPGPVIWLIVCPPAGLWRRAGSPLPARLRHHHDLHLAHGLRILARPQRAAGVALAGDLHAVRARLAVPAAHAACRHAAVSPTASVFESVWLTVLSFEALLFTIAIAFILLAMAKERTEYRHKTAAMVDPLTGIANRRSFLHDAAELTKRHAATLGADRGAADGPRSFQVDQRPLRPCDRRPGAAGLRRKHAGDASARTDLFGRLGGEEFAAVLGNVRREEAVALAERIHAAFRRGRGLCRRLCRSAPPSSIGVVLTEDAALDMPELLGAGRPGALLRQGARPQPGRGRDLRPHAQAQGRRLAAACCGQDRSLRQGTRSRRHATLSGRFGCSTPALPLSPEIGRSRGDGNLGNAAG